MKHLPRIPKQKACAVRRQVQPYKTPRGVDASEGRRSSPLSRGVGHSRMGDEVYDRSTSDGDAAATPRLTKCADLLPGYTVFRYHASSGVLTLCTVPTPVADSTEVESAVIALGEVVARARGESMPPERVRRLTLMQDAL
jgi:hypothetical protein